MNLFFLAALMLSWTAATSASPAPTRLWEQLLAAIVGVAAVAFFARTIALAATSQLAARPESRARILTWHYRLRWVRDLLSVVVYGVLLYRCGWPSAVEEGLGLRAWFLLDDLVLLAPYLLAELLSIAAYYRVEEWGRGDAAARPRRTLGEYVSEQFRHQFGILLAAAVLVMALKDVAGFVAPGWLERPLAAVLLVGLISLTVMAVSPWILRLVWKATPLPPGRLREELESLARRLGFRFSDLLVWRTSGVANAAVSGILPQLRYVLLSDTLLRELTAIEVAAVFGHEIGHVRRHHFSYYFLVIVASVLFASMLAALGEEAILEWSDGRALAWAAALVSYVPLDLILLAPFFALVLGHLSRTFERQADLFGVRATSQAVLDIERTLAIAPSVVPSSGGGELPVVPDAATIYINALKKAAWLNGMEPRAWTWRHGSLQSRIDFLNRVRESPELADRFDRKVRRFRWAMAAALGLGIAALVPFAPLPLVQ